MAYPKTYSEEDCTKFFSKFNLRYKKVEPCDLEAVDELCREVHFDAGLHNLKLFYETSPNTWIVVLDEKNQAILIQGLNQMPNGILYAYATVIHHQWRGKGFTKMLEMDTINSPFMTSSTPASIDRGLVAKYWLDKKLGFTGFCTRRMMADQIVPSVPNVIIDRLRPHFIDRLLKYDQKIALIDRGEFIRHWTMPDDSNLGRTLVAIDANDGSCLGYGTMRFMASFYTIQPLYAENEEIARALMTALLKRCLSEDAYVYIPVMASNRTVSQFCSAQGMAITYTDVKNCSQPALQYARRIPVEKAYAVLEYYPI